VLDLYRGDTVSVRFVTELDPRLPSLKVDPGRIRQLLHNLIKNSIEAAVARPCVITIRTARMDEAAGHSIEMRVQDNGPGLPPEMLGRFFEPYFSTKRRGSGLGLAIVKKIVEEHGGSVTAENAAEGGAVIIIRLPLDAGIADGSGEPEEERDIEPGRRGDPASGIRDLSQAG